MRKFNRKRPYGNFRVKNHFSKLENLWKTVAISLISLKMPGPVPY